MPALELLCTVKSFTQLTPTVFEVTFEPSQPLHFEAGQFVSVVVPNAGPSGRGLRRAYSIASGPGKAPIELCVKLVENGPGTNYLYKLRPGDTFKGYAPYGDFTYVTPPERHAVFISTGTGIAPFRSMIQSPEAMAKPPRSMMLLLGVREENELLYSAEMRQVRGLKWVECVSRPTPAWNGFKGRVTDYLRSLGGDMPWTGSEYYLCGGSAMIDEVKAILTERGVPKEQIHQEIYYKEPKPS